MGAVTVNSGGTVAPASSAGRLTINGNYNQTSNGKLAVELGGYAPGTEYDQLAVSGQAIVGGTLNVSLINGFRPNVGDTFAIIASSSESGNFSTINSPGFSVRSDASPSGVVLTITGIDPLPLFENTNDNGPGSLRFIIANASADSAIIFAPNVRGAIDLTSGELLINKNLTINGPGANLLAVQRSAASDTPSFRIFNGRTVSSARSRYRQTARSWSVVISRDEPYRRAVAQPNRQAQCHNRRGRFVRPECERDSTCRSRWSW